MVYYLETNLIAIIIAITILIHSKSFVSKNESSQIVVRLMLATLILLSTSDMLAYIFREDSYIGMEISNLVYFFMMAVGTFLWFLYILIKSGFREKMTRKTVIFISIPMIIFMLSLLSNPWTNYYFSIDQDLLYHRGPGVILSWIVEWAYMLAATSFNIKAYIDEKSNYKKREYRGYLIFAIPLAVTAVCQMLFYGTTTIQIGYAIALLMVYLNRQYYQIQRDDLTGLNNKNAYLSYLDGILDKNNSYNFTLFMIDADNFKTINDNYSHIKGDIALQEMALAIKLAAEKITGTRLMIFRYGGDEFIVIGKDLPLADEVSFVKEINHQLEIINNRNTIRGENYHLSLSVGVSQKECSTQEEFELLLKQADENMYIQKANKKKSN